MFKRMIAENMLVEQEIQRVKQHPSLILVFIPINNNMVNRKERNVYNDIYQEARKNGRRKIHIHTGTFYPRLNKEIDDASNACVFLHTKQEGRRETTVIVCHTVSPCRL